MLGMAVLIDGLPPFAVAAAVTPLNPSPPPTRTSAGPFSAPGVQLSKLAAKGKDPLRTPPPPSSSKQVSSGKKEGRKAGGGHSLVSTNKSPDSEGPPSTALL